MSITSAAGLFQPGCAPPPGTIDLGLGYPDESTFPTDLIDLTVLTTSAGRSAALSYGPPAGNRALLDTLRRTVMHDEACTENALITNGSGEAIDLALRACALRGNTIITEDPTFPGLLPAATNAGLQVIGVPSDGNGIEPWELSDTIDRAHYQGQQIAGLYLMPSSANPTGVRLSEDRCQAIAELTARRSLVVIEDDAYRHLTFDGTNTSTLHTRSPANVVNIRTLSKVVFPGGRLAISVGPTEFVNDMIRFKPVGGTTPFGSEIIAGLLNRLDYASYVAGLRTTYRTRRDSAVNALHTFLPTASFNVPSGGFFLWVTLPNDIDAEILYSQALKDGLRVMPGNAFVVGRLAPHTIRLSFSYESIDRMITGIQILAASSRAV